MPPRIEPTGGGRGAPLLLGRLGHPVTLVLADNAAVINFCTDICVPGDDGEYCMLLLESSSLSSISSSSAEFSAASTACGGKFVGGPSGATYLPLDAS